MGSGSLALSKAQLALGRIKLVFFFRPMGGIKTLIYVLIVKWAGPVFVYT